MLFFLSPKYLFAFYHQGILHKICNICFIRIPYKEATFLTTARLNPFT